MRLGPVCSGLGTLVCFALSAAPEASAQGFAPARLASESFGWSAGAGGWSVEEHLRLLGDINGDGRADVVGFGGRGVWVALGVPDGTFAPATRVLNTFGSAPSGGSWGRIEGVRQDITHPRHLADVNGDGRDDIVGFGDKGTWVSLGQSDGSFGDANFALPSFGGDSSAGGWGTVEARSREIYPRLLGDVNGDGRADIVGFGGRGVSVALGQEDGGFTEANRVLNSFGNAPAAGGWEGLRHPRLLGDVNGDGRSDIVGFGEHGTSVSLGQSDGTFSEPSVVLKSFGADPDAGNWAPIADVDGNPTFYPRLLGDVNGDDRADIIGFGNRATWVALGQGDGTFSDPVRVLDYFGAAEDAGGFRVDSDVRLVGDVNGDGRDDIVGMGGRGAEVSLAQEDGTVSGPVVALADFGRAFGSDHQWTGREPRLLADINGDGRADIVGFRDNGTYVALARGDGPAADPNPEVLDVAPARPEFTWSVPSRYADSWAAYNPEDGTYDDDYIHPKFWSVTIDACGSSGGGAAIQVYRFEIEGIDHQSGIDEAGCIHEFDDLPGLGAYRIAVSVRTKVGWSKPAIEEIERTDWLVVSIGDSFASGEGNPDERGFYPPKSGWSPAVLPGAPTLRARWQDTRCHRSARSGHAMAAQELERRDPHTSITFLALGCSGAEPAHLTDSGYKGPECRSEETDCSELIPAQIDVLEDLVVGRDEVEPRDVDVVLLAVGINVFDFANLIEDCAHPINTRGSNCVGRALVDFVMFHDLLEEIYHTNSIEDYCTQPRNSLRVPCVSEREQALYSLPEQWRKIDRRIERLPGNAEVYWTDYPSDPLYGGGCGKLDVFAAGVSHKDGRLIAALGARLIDSMQVSSNLLGWNYKSGMTAAFDGHAYCSDQPYYVKLSTSVLGQGNKNGTLHPNAAGHPVYRDLLLDAIVLAPSFQPWKRAKVVIDQVRVDARAGPITSVSVTVGTDADRPQNIRDHRKSARTNGRQTQVFSVNRRGAWNDLPAEDATFTFGLYLPPVPPRFPTTVSVVARSALGEDTVSFDFSRAENYGVGYHEAQVGALAIRYHIEITDVARPCPTVVSQAQGGRFPGLVPSPTAPVPCEAAR